MQAKYHLLLMFFLLATVLCLSLLRDIQVEKEYTVDLRNRVVGARLQMDGKSPYFYKWKPADGLRYYDPIKFDTTYASAITASPFFHDLLFPIANLQQRTISRICLAIEYIMLIGCLFFALSFTKNISQQWAITIFFTLFIFSEAWAALIRYGQIYIVPPFFCFAFLFCFERKNHFIFSFLAGLIASAIVLTRPTLILFLLPFIFFIKTFPRKSILFFFIPVVILFGYNFLDKEQRGFWADYGRAIQAHIKHHESGDAFARNASYSPVVYKRWEGWDLDSVEKAKHDFSPKFHLQFSNMQWIGDKIFNLKISVSMLNISCIIIIVGLLIGFVFEKRNEKLLDIAVVAIFGFCLYMITDFFSPISRTNYYAVQWIFPLFLAAAYYDRRLKFLYLLLIIGLLLNVLDIHFIKMRHTVGEYIILATLLCLCFSGKWKLRNEII